MMGRYDESDELTIPQERLVRDVAAIEAEQQVTRALRRVWYGMLGIIVTVMGWGIFLSFETGVRADRQDNNFMQIQALNGEVEQLANARTIDESQASATNATLAQIQIQLVRIENQVDKK